MVESNVSRVDALHPSLSFYLRRMKRAFARSCEYTLVPFVRNEHFRYIFLHGYTRVTEISRSDDDLNQFKQTVRAVLEEAKK